MKFRTAAFVAAIMMSVTGVAGADQVRSARIVTSSEDIHLTKSDHTIGLKRTVKPHKMTVLLPADAEPDQEFVVDDLARNFSGARVMVRAPDGHKILLGWPAFEMNVNGQHAAFRYFGEKTWGVEQ